MKVLIACECSQTVCKEFRALGHEAYSCDVELSYGGYPKWHIQKDVLKILEYRSVSFFTQDGEGHTVDKWDLIIAHPPCTYLSNAATSKHSLKSSTLEEINERTAKRVQAQEFFIRIVNSNCERIAIENPVGIMSTVYRKPDQIIEPYQFAESEEDKENYVTKRTCLWLKGLQPLKINDLPRPDIKAMYGTWSNGKARCWNELVYSKERAVIRSKTFTGIAKAMAEQWG